MPNVNSKARVLVRDGFVCQYCGCLLLLPQAVKVLDWRVSGLELWDPHGKREPLRSRWATVDHLVSEEEGGTDEAANLVACCVPCNSREGSASAQTPPPRVRKGDWDGLSSLFLALASQYHAQLSGEDVKWRKALERNGIAPSLAHFEAVVDVLRKVKASEVADMDELFAQSINRSKSRE